MEVKNNIDGKGFSWTVVVSNVQDYSQGMWWVMGTGYDHTQVSMGTLNLLVNVIYFPYYTGILRILCETVSVIWAAWMIHRGMMKIQRFFWQYQFSFITNFILRKWINWLVTTCSTRCCRSSYNCFDVIRTSSSAILKAFILRYRVQVLTSLGRALIVEWCM